jgi:hypothetical protein
VIACSACWALRATKALAESSPVMTSTASPAQIGGGI